MFKRFFITGTDTSVGKTVVSRALLQALAARGKSVAGYKPVAKGSKETPDGLRNKDALVLQSVSTLALPYEAVNPIALSEDELPDQLRPAVRWFAASGRAGRTRGG